MFEFHHGHVTKTIDYKFIKVCDVHINISIMPPPPQKKWKDTFQVYSSDDVE